MTRERALCFLDLETTGVDVYEDHPVQIGAVLVTAIGVPPLGEFESLVKPPDSRPSSKMALSIHGIDAADLARAPGPGRVLRRFFSKMGVGYSFAGWNVCFDLSFFRRLCEENQMAEMYAKISHRHVDVQSVARACSEVGLLPSNVESLSDVCRVLEIRRSVKHSALEDARITWRVYGRLIKMLAREGTRRMPDGRVSRGGQLDPP